MTGSAVPLEQTPFLKLTETQLRLNVDRHGITVGGDEVRRLKSMGIVHSIYAVGESMVLRVPKQHPDAIRDAYTGSAAAPAAERARVSTPRLLVFDDECDIVPVPYSIFERIHADPLSLYIDVDLLRVRSIWRDLGAQLAILYCNATGISDPHGHLDPHGRLYDPEPLLAHLERDGYLGNDAALWVRDVLRRLQPAVPPPGVFDGSFTATSPPATS